MSIRRSLGLTAIAQGLTFLISLASVVIISRVLQPHEIGIFSVAVALVAMAHIFRDFGVGQYLVQVKELTRAHLRASFTLMLLISWLIAGLLFVARSPIGAFYGNQGVAEVLVLLAANFVILPFGAPILSVLRREMQFDKIAILSVSHNLVQAVVTVGTALVGESYLSMAWGSLAGTATNVAMLWWFKRGDVFLRPTLKGLRDVVHFGYRSSAISLFSELGTRGPDFILGRTLGFDAVAFFSRGAAPTTMVVGGLLKLIRGVYFPAFARKVREGEHASDLYGRSMAYICGMSVPLIGLLAFMANPLIVAVFGPQWSRSAPIATMLCISSLFAAPFAMAVPALIACGKLTVLLRVQLASQSVRLMTLMTSTFLPLEGVVAAFACLSLFDGTLYARTLRREFGLRLGDLWRHTRGAYVLMLAALTGPTLLWSTLKILDIHLNDFVYLAAVGVLAIAGWLGAIAIIHHPLLSELQQLMRRLRKRRSAK